MDDPATTPTSRYRNAGSRSVSAGTRPDDIERRESVASQDESVHSAGRRSSNGTTAQQRLQQRKIALAHTQSLGLDGESLRYTCLVVIYALRLQAYSACTYFFFLQPAACARAVTSTRQGTMYGAG